MIALIQSDTSVMLQHGCNMYDEDIAFGGGQCISASVNRDQWIQPRGSTSMGAGQGQGKDNESRNSSWRQGPAPKALHHRVTEAAATGRFQTGTRIVAALGAP